MKKKIILSIVLIFLIFISSFSLSFTRRSKGEIKKYDTVIKDSIKNYNARIVDIAMLGAHDAFSSGIKYRSRPNVNEGGIVNNKLVNLFLKGFSTRMSKAQIASAKEMLYAGVRYFDVRITKIDDTYYAFHGYLSHELDYYLKDIVDFLLSHPGEFIIFDIQEFYTSTTSSPTKEDYEDLLLHMMDIKNEDGYNLLDYVNYDTSSPISTLRYTNITRGGSTAGIILLGKIDGISSIYYRDSNADFSEDREYKTIRSLWHNKNSDKEMLEGINKEYEFLKNKGERNVLVVNQAQKTGFIMNQKLIKSIFNWSLINFADKFNAKLVKDEDTFKEWLKYMPIFMVDYSTSEKGNFNTNANKYIMEYNSAL